MNYNYQLWDKVYLLRLCFYCVQILLKHCQFTYLKYLRLLAYESELLWQHHFLLGLSLSSTAVRDHAVREHILSFGETFDNFVPYKVKNKHVIDRENVAEV